MPDSVLSLRCIRCRRAPDAIPEYVEMARVEGTTPEAFVRADEGTLNPQTGLFACTVCYMNMGAPTAGPTGRWRAGDPETNLNSIIKPKLHIHVAQTVEEARECRTQGFFLVTMIRAEYGFEPQKRFYETYRYRFGSRASQPRFVVLARSKQNDVWINENDTLLIASAAGILPQTPNTAYRVGWLAGYLGEERRNRPRNLLEEGRPGEILHDWRSFRAYLADDDTWQIAINDWVTLFGADAEGVSGPT